MGPNRATLLASLPSAVDYAQAIQEEKLRGQRTLFGGGGDLEEDGVINLPPPDLHLVDEWPSSELQAREKVVLGYYISSHPLEDYRREIEGLASHRLGDKDEFNHDVKVRVCVVLSSVKFRNTRNGEMMAILKIEDLTGSIEALVFPQTLEKYRELLISDGLVGISGRISRQDFAEEPKIKVEEIIDLEEAAKSWSRAVRIEIAHDHITQPLVDRLEKVFDASPGECSLFIDLSFPSGDIKTLKVNRFHVQPAPEMLRRLSDLVGDEHVRFSR